MRRQLQATDPMNPINSVVETLVEQNADKTEKLGALSFLATASLADSAGQLETKDATAALKGMEDAAAKVAVEYHTFQQKEKADAQLALKGMTGALQIIEAAAKIASLTAELRALQSQTKTQSTAKPSLANTGLFSHPPSSASDTAQEVSQSNLSAPAA